jgi:predicted nucleotidyltransferase
MTSGMTGLRGYHPPLTHSDVIPVPSHVGCEKLGQMVPVMSDSPNQWWVESGCILRVTVGSGVHGMAIEGTDDIDEMGVFIERPETMFGHRSIKTYTWRSQPEGHCSGPGDLDLVVYSLRHYVHLAASGNPTVLLLLYVDDADIQYVNDFGTELRDMAPMFAAKSAGVKFRGYLESQRQGLIGLRSGGSRNQGRKDYRDKFGFDVKFAAHMLRLGYQGIEYLKTGRISLPIPEPELTYLRDLKSGEFLDGAEPGSEKWRKTAEAKKQETLRKAKRLEGQLTQLIESSPLRDRPDMHAIDQRVIDMHRRHWGWT